MKNGKYDYKVSDDTRGKGEFRTITLSPEVILIVCNTLQMQKTSGYIKELDQNGDSTVVGVYDGYKKLGLLTFEITSKKDGGLKYRKTFTNDLKFTEEEGLFVKK